MKKRLAALLLAMMMALSVLAVTGAAYGEEEHVHDETCCAERIVPSGAKCLGCNGDMYFYRNFQDSTGYWRPVYICYDCGTLSWGLY